MDSSASSATQQRIVDYMVERLGLEAEEITPTTRFKEDLDLDSLDMVELVTILEEETGARLDGDAAEALTTLGDVIAFIESRRVSDGSVA